MAKGTAQEDGFAFKFVVANVLILVFCLTAFNIRLDFKERRFQNRYHSYVTSNLKNAYTAAQAYFTDYRMPRWTLAGLCVPVSGRTWGSNFRSYPGPGRRSRWKHTDRNATRALVFGGK